MLQRANGWLHGRRPRYRHILHGRLRWLKSIKSGVRAAPDEPDRFRGTDEEPVDLIFLLLAPEQAGGDSAGGAHLAAAARASHPSKSCGFRKSRCSHWQLTEAAPRTLRRAAVAQPRTASAPNLCRPPRCATRRIGKAVPEPIEVEVVQATTTLATNDTTVPSPIALMSPPPDGAK